jgi:hypothetical protein
MVQRVELARMVELVRGEKQLEVASKQVQERCAKAMQQQSSSDHQVRQKR